MVISTHKNNPRTMQMRGGWKAASPKRHKRTGGKKGFFQVSQSREGVASVIHQRVQVEGRQVGGAGSPGWSGAECGAMWGTESRQAGTVHAERQKQKKNKI